MIEGRPCLALSASVEETFIARLEYSWNATAKHIEWLTVDSDFEDTGLPEGLVLRLVNTMVNCRRRWVTVRINERRLERLNWYKGLGFRAHNKSVLRDAINPGVDAFELRFDTLPYKREVK